MPKNAPAAGPMDPASPDALLANVRALASKLLAMTHGKSGNALVLWRKTEFVRVLSSSERPLLDQVLAHLESSGDLLRLPDGSRSERFLFAVPLRHWLDGFQASQTESLSSNDGTNSDMFAAIADAYPKLVRESGGFPDVKISALQRALPSIAPAVLGEHLRALWNDGSATLSLGDWSLASEEMRNAAIELDGERYLLVRLENSSDELFPD